MSFQIETFGADQYAERAATMIAGAIPERGAFVLTGGTTAERIYPKLAALTPDLSEVHVLFSDERCVPPDDDASNFKMAEGLLLRHTGPEHVHRMRGEDDPAQAAAAYHRHIEPLVEAGLDLLLLGMGADAHIGAMFPNSPALAESKQLCRAVDRPDGMQGLTLTPPALLSAKKILLLVTGEAKAATVKRVIEGDEPIETCPARLLATHPDATFLLDEPAASAL